jgi:uncharacterized membrane protein
MINAWLAIVFIWIAFLLGFFVAALLGKENEGRYVCLHCEGATVRDEETARRHSEWHRTVDIIRKDGS